jgi:hypothetical protein
VSPKFNDMQWGMNAPPRLCKGNGRAVTVTACVVIMSGIIRAGVDKDRYGKLLHDVSNNYLTGTDEYPSRSNRLYVSCWFAIRANKHVLAIKRPSMM